MRAFALFVSAGVVLSAALAAAQEPPEVGDLGNPDQIVVEGAKTFAPADIINKLLADLDVIDAAYPTAPLAEFEQTLTEKLLTGYRDNGFAEATAETRLDESLGKLVLTIVEGPRYVASAVHVSGLPEADAEWLRRELSDQPHEPGATAKTPPGPGVSQKALRWPVGKPAWCANLFQRWHKQIEHLLVDRGLVLTEFSMGVQLDRKHHTATLEVVFTDAGQPAVVGEIRITGNKANSREDILKFLDLTPGMAYAEGLCERVAEKLVRSGRFIKSSVRLIKPKAPGERLVIAIEVSEYDKAPLLRETLSKGEAALIKVGAWAAGFDQGKEELLWRTKGDGMELEIVVAPQSRIVAMLRELPVKDRKIPELFAVAMVVDRDHLSLYSAKRRRQVTLPARFSHSVATLALNFRHESPAHNQVASVGLGFGLKSRAKRSPFVEVKLNSSPVSLLALAHHDRWKMSWNNGLLSLDRKDEQLLIDPVSGRPVKMRAKASTEVTTVAAGEFERRVREIDAVGAMYPNDADVDRPATSVLDFVCTEAATLAPESIRKKVDVVHHLLDAGLLLPLERRLGAARSADEVGFSIPTADEDLPSDIDDPRSILHLLAQYLRPVELLVPRGSWPDRLAREAVLVLYGKSRHLHQEIAWQVSSPDAGPLRYAGVALTSALGGLEVAATRYGREGLNRLSPDLFHKDCECLLDPAGLAGECVANTCHALGQLDEDEAATVCEGLVLAGMIAETGRDKLAACLAKLRAEAAEGPRQETMYELLDVLWLTKFKDLAERGLRWMANLKTRELVNKPDAKTTSPDGANDKTGGNGVFQPGFRINSANKGQAKPSTNRYR
jgi:hypothetical protein